MLCAWIPAHGRPFPMSGGHPGLPRCMLYDKHPCFAPQIAGFIFGGNIKQDKIAMTSPVQTEANGQHQNGEESEKMAMTSPVTSEMLQGGKRVHPIHPLGLLTCFHPPKQCTSLHKRRETDERAVSKLFSRAKDYLLCLRPSVAGEASYIACGRETL